ncbi:MAG: penicillin-binding protein 1C [Bacteroidia bacterium]
MQRIKENGLKYFRWINWRIWRPWLALVTAFVVLFMLLVPSLSFDPPYSSVLTDRNGQLLGARVAADGQWRFPPSAAIPERFSTALLAYEDRWFYWHPGINPVAMLSALYDAMFTDLPRRGGSTISMQLARLHYGARKRSLRVKLVEVAMALKAELMYSKKSLLAMYVAHAPFGGNVVGLEAATWRYYHQQPALLTWSEAAALAVLPNSPALVFPGKNEALFLRKRNKLLARLHARGQLSDTDYQLALAEPLPGKARALPNQAPHLMNRFLREGYGGKRAFSTIDGALQDKVNQLAMRYVQRLAFNEVNNLAVMVADVRSGEVLAYVHASGTADKNGADVDVLDAPRSYGSLLKPFLYAAMLSEGSILPAQLIEDRPIAYSGFMPQNFQLDFDGMVPAHQVLSRSLNVPSVNMLRQYGTARFLHHLRQMGLNGLNRSAEYYGLSLILGGAEARLWQLCGMYGSFAHRLNTNETSFALRLTGASSGMLGGSSWSTALYSRSSVWFTLQAITENKRPVTQSNWEYFPSSRKIAWKTGTSFGHRDAWSIGLTPDYVVGVWAGNASGEGRSGLTGVLVAAPVMFDVFYLLPESDWFAAPDADLRMRSLCRETGMLAGRDCETVRSELVQADTDKARVCQWHQLQYTDSSGRYRVHANCYPMQLAKPRKQLVLPAAAAWYYRQKNPTYEAPLPWLEGCMPAQELQQRMQLLYPSAQSRIYLPLGRDSLPTKAVFEALHSEASSHIYWHIDGHYIGQTTDIHKISVQPAIGRHLLSLVDERGNQLERWFEVVASVR